MAEPLRRAAGVFIPKPAGFQGLACGLAMWQSKSRMWCKGKIGKALEIGNLIANGLGFWQCGNHQGLVVLVLPLVLRKPWGRKRWPNIDRPDFFKEPRQITSRTE